MENDKTRVNLFITRKADSRPKLVFNTHLDTVPPYISPVKHDDGRICGRGSNDAKGKLEFLVYLSDYDAVQAKLQR